jgi:hypothetical protein
LEPTSDLGIAHGPHAVPFDSLELNFRRYAAANESRQVTMVSLSARVMRRFLVTASVVCVPTACLLAQRLPLGSQLPVTTGIGVDTTASNAWGRPWQRQIASIYKRWSEFLASDRPRYTALGMAPSPYWDLEEQRRWITFPLALNLTGGRGAPTILDIRPATPGTDSVYVVKTLFSSPEGSRLPLALVRVYAVRRGGQWVFSNALPRLTRSWRRVAEGPFTYVVAPGYRFRPEQARLAVAFTDSVARAFGVRMPHDVEYYLTESPDEMNRILGIDWMPSATDGGALSSGPNHLMVSGDARQGENYRHELVHIALTELSTRGVHPLVWEGVATWLGGTLGMSSAESRDAYAKYVGEHPDLTLETVMHGGADQGFRPAGAAMIQMAYAQKGLAGVKDLLGAGPREDALKAALQRVLGARWTDIQSRWRQVARQ